MAYAPQTWTNGDTETPLSAARLTHIEEGIEAADSAATAPTTWASVTGKPAVIAAGTDAAAARTAIGAGTGNGSSNLTLAQAQAGIATKAEIAALTEASTIEDVIAALQA